VAVGSITIKRGPRQPSRSPVAKSVEGFSRRLRAAWARLPPRFPDYASETSRHPTRPRGRERGIIQWAQQRRKKSLNLRTLTQRARAPRLRAHPGKAPKGATRLGFPGASKPESLGNQGMGNACATGVSSMLPWSDVLGLHKKSSRK
jgi:hypothetical protein